MEMGPHPRLGFNLNGTQVTEDDAQRRGKPQTTTEALRGVERIEDAAQIRRLDTPTIIGNGQAHELRRGQIRLESEGFRTNLGRRNGDCLDPDFSR